MNNNSFKFIYLVGIVIVIAIVVSLGLFVMKSSQDFTNSAKDKMSLTDANEFNNMWLHYKGKQKGTSVKRMIQQVVSNAEENSKNADALVDIAYKAHEVDDFSFIYSTVKEKGTSKMKNLISDIDDKHYYTVEFVYAKSKQISGIIIKYSENDKVEFVPDEN